MVDTYSKGADSRKLYKKNHGDGEDPIIIAQRFLNIFRQLHIFSTERKEAFNKMILEQPPEIRGMFGSLPGGSVLQEYVDELEQSAGVARDHSGEFQTASATPELNDEISRAKILATALAEAQIQANAKLQNSIPQAQPQPAAAAPQPAAPTYAGPAKIVADASFAKEIAAAFSQALKFSEERSQTGNKQLAAAVIASQEKMAKIFAEKSSNSELTSALIATQEKMAQALAENAAAIKNMPVKSLGSGKETSFSSPDGSREILDAIRESQDRMAQMIMQHNTMAASNSSNTNANNIQINATPMPPMEDIVKGIVKAQSELFREMSETQTKELSAIISVALKESQQLSTQTIVEAMERMQKENQKFFEQQTKNAPKVAVQPVYIQQEKDKTPRPIPISPAEQEDFQIPEINPGTENDELNELFSDENNAAEDEEELPKKRKKKKKKKNKNKDSGAETNGLDFSLFDDGVQAAAKLKDGIKDGLSSLASSLFKKDEKNENIGLPDIDADMPLSETPTEFPNTETPAESPAESAEPTAEDAEWTWEEVPAEETTAAETENAAVESAEPAAEDAEWTWEEVPAEETTAAETENAAAESAEPAAEDAEWTWEEVPAEETTAAETENAAAESAEPAAEDAEWTWEEVPAEETTAAETENAAAESAEPAIAATENQNEDFNLDDLIAEYSGEQPTGFALTDEQENTAEEVPAAEMTAASDESEDGDWEWEYEEVPEDQTETPPENTAEEIPAAEMTAASDESEDGDWEWEYEEVPEDQTETPPENTAKEIPTAEMTAASDESEDGDWEWEYEEVPEDQTETPPENTAKEIPAAEMTAAPDESEDGDWEWEYEEVPEDQTETPPENTAEEVPAAEITAAPDESEDGDWEWEYEEVPEDQTETPQESKETATEAAADSYVTENDEETANPLYSGDLIFHDDVYKNADDASPLPVVGLNLGIAEISDEKENKEPYIPKDDIVG
ncbi:MAG: hypothetical protein ACLU5H_09430 [Alphaproteobacteria bacterium]